MYTYKAELPTFGVVHVFFLQYIDKGKDDSGQFQFGVEKDKMILMSRSILSRDAIDGGLPSFANIGVVHLKSEQT